MDALLSQFPSGSALDADGMVLVGGCRADELVTELQAPHGRRAGLGPVVVDNGDDVDRLEATVPEGGTQ